MPLTAAVGEDSIQGRADMSSLSLEELATRAEVTEEYVRRLIELGALEGGTGPEPYGPSDVRRVQLLRSWEVAGFPAETLVDLVRAGELSVSWLDAAVMTRAERLDLTYEQVCREQDVPLALMRALQGPSGSPRPTLTTTPGKVNLTWRAWSRYSRRSEFPSPGPWG